jgi:septal ring factor EnvC (AmiA/AmiB activator)
MGAGVLFKLGRTWGCAQADLKNHAQRLDASNGAIKEQKEKDEQISKQLSAIETNCKERLSRLVRNDREHDEIFGRLRALETGIASVPGQVAEQIDRRFEQWRATLKGDVRLAINDYYRRRGDNSETPRESLGDGREY